MSVQRQIASVATGVLVHAFGPWAMAGVEQWSLTARVYDASVAEVAPLTVRLELRNQSPAPAKSVYREMDPGLLDEYCTITLTSDTGRVDRLASVQIGAESSMTVARVAEGEMPPGVGIQQDVVRALVVRRAPTAQWSGEIADLYEFLPPGGYNGRAEVWLGGGDVVASPEFKFRIAVPDSSQAPVRQRLGPRHMAFLVGRNGNFGAPEMLELQQVLAQHPDSVYARWFGFWKVYYHGALNDTLTYAREHPEFPLSDNLLLHRAEDLFHAARYSESRSLLDELVGKFAQGDTRAAALDLQQRLTRKP